MSTDTHLINAALKNSTGKPLNLTIKDGSVTNTKLSKDAVSTDKIQNEAVTEEKISSEALKSINDKASEASKEAATKADEARERMEQTMNSMKEVIDSSAIKDDGGNLVPSPFKYVQNKEFIFAMVDAEDKLLAGIQWDGTPVHGKTSSIEDKMQSQIDLIANRVATIIGDEDTTNVIDTMNELKTFFANIENTETLTGILTNLDNVAKNLDKTTIKDEEGNIQDTPFKVIENEEFIHAITDSEDRLLFGIYRETGKPYFPLNEMYHVEQNEEFFAVWLDAADHVLLGIRRDGEIIGEIHAVNALKQVISQLQSDLTTLQEKVGTIDTSLQELLSVFSLQENEEYLAVETDAEGKILSSTNPDGSHYIYNAKSETIPEEFEHIEDPEDRMEITTDTDGKVIGYRDSEGTRHEHKMSLKHLELSDEAATEVNNAFKSAGIKMENPSDFSNYEHIELPIPRIAAQVRIYAPKLPTTKTDDIEAEIEYNDKDGNYFRKPVILNAQGSSSMYYYVKNMAIDINDGSEIKFGDFPTQDSFHLKKYYIDIFRGQCVIGYWLMEQVYQTHPIGKRYPYEMLADEYGSYTGKGIENEDFYTGGKCHPDGFPVNVTFINTITNKEKDMGIYALNLKKSKEVYCANKKKTEHIILDGVIDDSTLFGGTIDWSQFEIRNPKSLIDINGDKYDGDNPNELSDTDHFSKEVKEHIIRLSNVKKALADNNSKDTFQKYFIVNSVIDYILTSQILYHHDGFRKNWIWCTWDGQHWSPTIYDTDSIFGAFWNGTFVVRDSDNSISLGNIFGINDLYKEEIEKRYKQLRDTGVFTVDNIMGLLTAWLNKIGYDNISKEIELYPETPSYRNPNISEGWEFVDFAYVSDNYKSNSTYNENDTCIYKSYIFKAKKALQGTPPLFSLYDNYPQALGFFNSPKRVKTWLENRIEFLDTIYNYNLK